jgi:hypothetical protein
MARDPNRLTGKRRQEEWMEEDDLLGGELEEQDLCYQLQKGSKAGPPNGGGYRGRDGRGQNLEGHERFGGNRPFNPRRNDFGRNYAQGGGGPGFITTREVGLQINILEVADLNTVQLTHGERPYGRKVWALRQV